MIMQYDNIDQTFAVTSVLSGVVLAILLAVAAQWLTGNRRGLDRWSTGIVIVAFILVSLLGSNAIYGFALMLGVIGGSLVASRL